MNADRLFLNVLLCYFILADCDFQKTATEIILVPNVPTPHVVDSFPFFLEDEQDSVTDLMNRMWGQWHCVTLKPGQKMCYVFYLTYTVLLEPYFGNPVTLPDLVHTDSNTEKLRWPAYIRDPPPSDVCPEGIQLCSMDNGHLLKILH